MTLRLMASGFAVSIALFAQWVEAAELKPDDFAFGMPLELNNDAAVFKFATPTEVYQYAVHDDLGDLRIFNGDGEWVPYTLSAPATPAGTREALLPVPMFPLRGDPVRALDNFRVTIASGMSTVNLQTGSTGTQPATVQAYVIDARSLQRPIAALELRWPDDTSEFSGSLHVESSDDLGQWHTLLGNAPVVNLHFAEQHLLQKRIEFTPVKAKFLRIQWQGLPAPPALTGVLAEPAVLLVEPERRQREVSGVVATDQADTHEFDLGAHAPVDRINIKLAQMNSFASVELSSRDQLQNPWQKVATLNLYELQNNGRLVRNPDYAITRNPHRYWRIHARPGTLGRGVPVLQAAWVPHEITFVARGRPPFQLAFGSATTLPATSSLQRLVATPTTGIRVGTVTVGALHELGGTARLQSPHERPWKMWLLWSALLLAIAGLAVVAYRLSREMSR